MSDSKNYRSTILRERELITTIRGYEKTVNLTVKVDKEAATQLAGVAVGATLGAEDAVDLALRILAELAPDVQVAVPPKPKFEVGAFVRRKDYRTADSLIKRSVLAQVLKVVGHRVTDRVVPSERKVMLQYVTDDGLTSEISQDLVERVDVKVREMWEVNE